MADYISEDDFLKPSEGYISENEFTGAPAGGFRAAAKQAIGSTIKGAGQLASDVAPALISQDNALKQYGQEVIDANPTEVRGFRDIVNKPLTTVKEATGNAAGSVGAMLGIRLLGQGITAVSPLAGPAAPVVAGVGQAISWGGPLAVAALPSFGGIREKQIENDPQAKEDWTAKAVAALGAGTVGLIETKFGPQNWALNMTTEAGRKAVAGMLASPTIKGAIGKGIVKGGAIEGAEELVQSPIEQLASSDDPLTKESLTDTAFGGTMGAIGGGVLGGAMGPMLRQSKEKDTVQAALLDKLTPEGTTVTVKGGEATITKKTANSTTTMKVPVAEAAKVMAAGGKVEDVAKKQFSIDDLSDPATPTQLSLRVKDKKNPDGKRYDYQLPEGMTQSDFAEIAKKMNTGQKFAWLRKNADQIKDAPVADTEAGSELNDTMYDFADQATAVQDEADVRKRRNQFENLRRTNAPTTEPQATSSNEPVQAVQPRPEPVVEGVPEPLTPEPLTTSPQELEQQILNEEINDAINIPSPSGVGDVPAAVVRDVGEAAASTPAAERLPNDAQISDRSAGGIPEAVREIDSGPQPVVPQDVDDLRVEQDHGYRPQRDEQGRKYVFRGTSPTRPGFGISRESGLNWTDQKGIAEGFVGDGGELQTAVISETAKRLDLNTDQGVKTAAEVLKDKNFASEFAADLGSAGENTLTPARMKAFKKAGYDIVSFRNIEGNVEFILNDKALIPQATPSASVKPSTRAPKGVTPLPGTAASKEAVRKYTHNPVTGVVSDDTGAPQKFFHGTSKAFKKIDPYIGDHGLFGKGAYVTDSPEISSSYTTKGKGGSPNIHPVYVDIKNPIDMDVVGERAQWESAFPDADFSQVKDGATNEEFYRQVEESVIDEQLPMWEGAEKVQDGLISMGYDGITHVGGGRRGASGFHRVYIAFDDAQTQSVFDYKAPQSVANKPSSKAPKVPKAFAKLAKDIDTVIKEDGVSEDFKRVPSFEAIAAYREKYPDDSPDTAMSELAWMPEAEYAALTAVEDEEVLFSQTQATGTTTQQVEQELKDFLGNGFNNLVRRGKLEVVQGVEQLPEAGVPLYTKTRKIAGVYLASKKKVVLVADNIKPEDAQYVMLHEGTHALLREDKVFVKQKDSILADFERLANTEPTVQAAMAKVPANTPTAVKTEEGLAYWLQEKKNHEHSLFKRVISAIKAALYRLGIAHGRLTASDMSALFTQGTQAWARQPPAAPEVTDPDILFSRIDDTLKAGQKKLDTAVQALKNPKRFLHEKYLEYAPQWLSVTPLHTLVQTFGKTIPQIRQFAKHLDAVVASKTEIVDTSAVLYEQAEKLAEAGAGLDVFNTAAATASFNRITPWADLYDQAWVPESGTKSDRLKAAQKAWVSAKMQQATGMSYTQAYTQSRKAYDALKTEDLKQAYIKVVEHIASVRIRERNNLLAYIESVSAQGSELRANLMAQFEASFSNLHGAYWPLSRVGDFRMEYTDIEGFRTVRHYTTLAERREDKAVILAEGVDPDTIKEDYKDKQPRGSVAIPQMLMGQLAEAVEKKALAGIDPNNADAVEAAQERAQAITDDMNQIWLRWQPETSALKNSVRRKNVRGFSKEMLRSYLDYMQRHASNIAWTEQGKKIEQDIKSLSDDIMESKGEPGMVDVTLQRHILNDLRNRIQALRSVSVGPVASVLGKLGTAYYMTSPSIALVQMSQLGVLTLPKLSTMFGAGKATTALAKGTRDAFKKDYTRDPMFADPVVNTVYKNMREVVTDENRNVPQARGKELGERLFTDQQILSQMKSFTPYQMQLITLREAMARNLLDISAAHEAYELTRGKDPKSLWNRAFKFAMLPMSLSELASRKATVLATYELAQQEGQDFFGTMNTIAEVVNDTLYSYSKENKGSAMQGGLSRVVLQFQHYRIMTGIRLAMLFRNAVKGESAEVKQAATKELVGVMGMSAALAGTMGLPLSGLVFSIMNLLLGDDDEPIDSELMYTNWLRETLGETAGDVVASGLPTLAGADLSGRIGLSGIYGMQNEPPSGLHGRNLAAWWAASQLGPIFSVGQGWFQGYDEIVNKGNYLKGLEAATPKPIKDGLKALRIGTDGLKNGQGKRLLADEAIGPDEIILVALGFNADEIAKAQSAERSLNKLSTKISERRGKLIRQAAQAFVEGDDASPALERVRAFNRSMPRFGINGDDIRPAIRKLLVGDLGTTGPRESLVAGQYEIPEYVRE